MNTRKYVVMMGTGDGRHQFLRLNDALGCVWVGLSKSTKFKTLERAIGIALEYGGQPARYRSDTRLWSRLRSKDEK